MNKTNTLIQRIKDVDNFQNMACFCDNWKEFTQPQHLWRLPAAELKDC